MNATSFLLISLCLGQMDLGPRLNQRIADAYLTREVVLQLLPLDPPTTRSVQAANNLAGTRMASVQAQKEEKVKIVDSASGVKGAREDIVYKIVNGRAHEIQIDRSGEVRFYKVVVSGGDGGRTGWVEAAYVATKAVPVNLRMVAKPAKSPDNGLLDVRMTFESSTGNIKDLFPHVMDGKAWTGNLMFRESLEFKGCPGPKCKTPWPFRAELPSPVAGQPHASEWGVGWFLSDFYVDTSKKTAFFEDGHGYTGFHAVKNPLPIPDRTASFTIIQQYEYSFDRVTWTPIGPKYEIVRSVVQKQGGRDWFYTITKGGVARELNISAAPPATVPRD